MAKKSLFIAAFAVTMPVAVRFRFFEGLGGAYI
jgi:hypothetical protein